MHRMTRTFRLVFAGLIALSTVHARDEEMSTEAPARSGYSPTAGLELPVFKVHFLKPTTIKAPFLEQFAYGWPDYLRPSNATKDSPGDGNIFTYIGQWALEEPRVFPGMRGDLGLVAKTPAAHHAISASLFEPVDNTGKTLVVQYEVKAQNGLVCGGAYMKLMTDSPEGIQSREFSSDTPYTIMFGPDRCGITDKVHFVFRHKNPITGLYEEKHLKNAPPAKVGQTSTLYTLIVRPDQTFEIKINNKIEASGSLLESFLPVVNPLKFIDDPQDQKPDDWVDEAQIPDSKATKPEDWDEDAPLTILDENATKPSDWLDEEPAETADPVMAKPENWDDDEDGDWTPASMPNPKCIAHGCGKWTRPSISNPAYKGKWTAPVVDNPAYKGVWTPRKTVNPEYFEDLHPSNFEKIGAFDFEIWTMQNDILFDNIYIGHSAADAQALAADSWEIKYAVEKRLQELSNAPPKHVEDDGGMTFKEDPLGFALQHLREFVELARQDPMQAINSRPLVVTVLAGIVGVSFGLMLIVLGMMSGDAPEEARVRLAKMDTVVPDKEDKAPKGGEEEEEEEKAESGERTGFRRRAAGATAIAVAAGDE